MQRKVDIIKDIDGNKIVFIHDIAFKGKRSMDWAEVEKYLKRFVGESYIIEESNDMIYIGSDLPDEYSHSNYTILLKGANAKAKANAVSGLPEMIEIATKKHIKKILKKNIRKMLSMAGIDTNQDLHCRYLVMMEIGNCETHITRSQS